MSQCENNLDKDRSGRRLLYANFEVEMTNQYVETVAGDGGHYSINRARDGMDLLRLVFPDGEANEMNICLFSTSGVHGL